MLLSGVETAGKGVTMIVVDTSVCYNYECNSMQCQETNRATPSPLHTRQSSL